MTPRARLFIGALTFALFIFLGVSLLTTGRVLFGVVVLALGALRLYVLYRQWQAMPDPG